MTTLEQQCEEIRKDFESAEFIQENLKRLENAEPEFREFLLGDQRYLRCWQMHTLLSYIDELRSTLACRDNDVASLRIQLAQANSDLESVRGENYAHSQDDGKLEREIERLQEQIAELRRPSDAKEIAAIQATVAELKQYWAGNPGDVPYNLTRYFEHADILLHALAESQRECAAALSREQELLREPWAASGREDRLAESLAESQRECARLQAENLAESGHTKSWRCFHCGEVCKSEVDARNHFGSTEGSEPACLIKAPGEFALLQALRNAEDRLQRYQAEDSDTLRAMYAMQSDHQQALRREEERGYAKGVSDMRAEIARLTSPPEERRDT